MVILSTTPHRRRARCHIAHATQIGDVHRILAGVAVMALYIVTINRLVWRRLYHLAETRDAL
jgi:NitT/TauT family transport system permease protein